MLPHIPALHRSRNPARRSPHRPRRDAPAPETCQPDVWPHARSHLPLPSPVLQNIHIQICKVCVPSYHSDCECCGSRPHPRSRSRPAPVPVHILPLLHPMHSFPKRTHNCRLPACHSKEDAAHADLLPRSAWPATSSPENTLPSAGPSFSLLLPRWTVTADGYV